MCWTPCNESLPDSDTTVLTFEPDSNEPVWSGYHDGEGWHDINGWPLLRVTHWRDFPDPPSM